MFVAPLLRAACETGWIPQENGATVHQTMVSVVLGDTFV
jgi:hypothetical protein